MYRGGAMQINYLANFILFYTQLNKFQWFKALAYLESMSVIKIPPRRFTFRHYEAKKEIKTLFNFKEKIVKQEFDILILQDQQFAFISNRERGGLVGNPEGSAILTAHSFAQKMTTSAFLGEKTLAEESTCLLYGIQWQSFIIYYAQIPDNQIMLFIQEINSVTTVRKLNLGEKEQPTLGLIRKQQISYHVQLFAFLKTIFDPILCLLFGESQKEEMMNRYLPELRRLIEAHPEMVKPLQNKKDQLDYTLVLYFVLAYALKQK